MFARNNYIGAKNFSPLLRIFNIGIIFLIARA
ncbi:hypothetical protein L280_11380 [Mannheimia haemolytica MhBrain2012]|nr:hypothetical protein F382_05715 [Mannheimia haemolytica D153]AGQ41039.1 hypothetical protein J451_05955 [Mannheimia haemolytica D174]AGR75957.1 hypothetical protein N220_11865 [Mannheimia haemolytica USMARC_2286]EPZ03001.1 hypothetical protein L279_06870 [Mannheimia haemolytica D38]EPZ27836.1 hypothetical protein L281_10525 [Mannheimia haemolytica MhSwine2000]EPZ28250.1 hypothetical protein L280_11380 [Mannheimia haemolytica MhBrain2012]EPZ29713.1 hypothetical protein L277_09585 [Mannheimi